MKTGHLGGKEKARETIQKQADGGWADSRRRNKWVIVGGKGENVRKSRGIRRDRRACDRGSKIALNTTKAPMHQGAVAGVRRGEGAALEGKIEQRGC